MDQELQKYTNKDTTEAGSDSFYTFVNKFLDDSQYLDYSEDYPDATKYNFLVSDTDLPDLSKAFHSTCILLHQYKEVFHGTPCRFHCVP